MVPKTIIMIVIAIVVLVVFYYIIRNKSHNKHIDETTEGMDDSSLPRYNPNGKWEGVQGEGPERATQMNPIKQNTDVLPYPQISNNYSAQGSFGAENGCAPKDTITAQELMPKDDSYNTWNESSPAVSGHIADRNFLESGHHFGIDTVSNTLKNPNLQLRSDPVIAQVKVGPWSQSTYGPDTNKRQLEIGGDY